MRRSLSALALAGAALAAAAQVSTNSPDWKELDAPPPPPLRTQGLVPVEVGGSALRFGVDPASVTVGQDAIVRYVVVATSASGAVNALYEGIRCDNGTVRVFARHNPDSGWVAASQGGWQEMSSSTGATRHSLAIARAGACQDHAPNGSALQIVQDLRAPIDRKFERGGVNR